MGKTKQFWQNHKQKQQTGNSGKKRLISWLVKGLIAFILLGLSISGISIWKEYRTPPEEVVIRAIAETIEAPCYSYYSLSKRILDGQETILSEVWGEKNIDNTHLSGKIHIVNSEFEIYQVNNKFYRQDVVSKQWLVVEDTGQDATERLIQEIDPLGNFIFANPIEAEYLGKETIDNKKCRKYQILAYGANQYLAASWGDFFYTVWIDREGHLRQAEVLAVDKEDEKQQLKMSVQFTVSQQDILIEAPL